MKTAVLISGQFRSGVHCYPSIKKHVLDRIGDHDVYCHLMLDGDAADAKIYSPKVLKFVEQPTLDEKNYIHRTGRQVYGVQGVLRQLWGLDEVYKLVEGDYDCYIRLRPDLEFFSDIEDLRGCDTACYIPRFHNWWGYNDRFGFMPKCFAETYFTRFRNLDDYVARNGIFHPETHLKWTLDGARVPIARTEVVFDTVRPNGQRFAPEYHSSCGDVPVV